MLGCVGLGGGVFVCSVGNFCRRVREVGIFITRFL